jgi:hypothetical protein
MAENKCVYPTSPRLAPGSFGFKIRCVRHVSSAVLCFFESPKSLELNDEKNDSIAVVAFISAMIYRSHAL